MKLVIDIDEKKLSDIIKHYKTFPKQMKDWGLEEIKNGKPLHPEYNSKICKGKRGCGMTGINPRHRKKKLEKYIGKNVRVTFKDGDFVEGILTHHGWRYGMDDCEWHSKNTNYSHFCHSSFCHSHVKKVDLLVM